MFPTITTPFVGSVLSISSGLEMAVDIMPAPFVTLSLINTIAPDASGCERECFIHVLLLSTSIHGTISHNSGLEPAHHSTEEIPLSVSKGTSQENDNKRSLCCLMLHEELLESLHHWTDEEVRKDETPKASI